MSEGELKRIVGNQNVLDSPEILEEYSKDLSFVLRMRPKCVVKPKNTGGFQKRRSIG